MLAALRQQMHELTQNIRKILQQRFHVSHTIYHKGHNTMTHPNNEDPPHCKEGESEIKDQSKRDRQARRTS